jgi:hypothetical protein
MAVTGVQGSNRKQMRQLSNRENNFISCQAIALQVITQLTSLSENIELRTFTDILNEQTS